MRSSRPERIAIFGATSAIAAACARLWAKQGRHLFLVGRSKEKLEAVLADLRCRAMPGQVIEAVQADLAEIEHHQALVTKAYEALSGLDAILIAHGSLSDQAACEASVELTLREIRTNALSVISLLTLVANLFEQKGCGTIAVISSVAGDRGRQSNYVYGSAKGFVTIFAQGLRNRLYSKGVRVVTVKPGFVDTPMTAHIQKKGLLWAKPEQVARGIVSAVDRGKDEVYLPWFWRPIMWVIRHLPECIFKRLRL